MQVIDCGTVWSDCLRVIQDNVAEQSYKTWFLPIKPYKLEDKVLTIQVPSQFFYEWLEEHYVQVLKTAIDAVLGAGAKLSYSVVVDQGGNAGAAPYTINLPNNQHRKTGSNNSSPNYNSPFELKSVESAYQSSQLNNNYTFHSYIEGDCNRLARSAGQAVAQKPGITSFNPLMLYGGVGLFTAGILGAVGETGHVDLIEGR